MRNAISLQTDEVSTVTQETEQCYHCGEVVPVGIDYKVTIFDELRAMCCKGCEAVANAIVEYGLEDFYRYRTEKSLKPEELIPEELQRLDIYDNPEIQNNFVSTNDADEKTASLILEDIVCPACCWLVEKQLGKMAGIKNIAVNYSTHRAQLSWDPDKLLFSDILKRITSLGHEAYPYDPSRGQTVLEQERKQQLRRIGVAGLFGMQVMMISIALYFGDWSGMQTQYKYFLHWIAFFLSLPIIIYSARPFLQRACRDLSLLQVSMDVPVSLGISIAFIASVWATFSGQGDVYYDSVAMFVFLLSGGRYYEFMARKKATEHLDSLERVIPSTAKRLQAGSNGNEEELVLVAELEKGERILVLPGETIPVDGQVVTGSSSVSEALVTGEANAIKKQIGDKVIGGSTNIESPLHIEVEKTGNETVLAQIMSLLEKGRAQKPALAVLTNKIAAWFVCFVLFLAIIVAGFWYSVPNADWLAITISVLIVSCPCALSLATPTAITAASSALMHNGVAAIKTNAIENLARITDFIFDKTGTLTEGQLSISGINELSDYSKQDCLSIAASIERFSEHPVAKGILAANKDGHFMSVEEVKNYPGEGITGLVNGSRYFIGNINFVQKMTGSNFEADLNNCCDKYVVLADEESLLCVFYLDDSFRKDAHELIEDIKSHKRSVAMLSGDDVRTVKKVSDELGISHYWGAQLPHEKLERVRELKSEGHVVAMIGDGINDAPVMADAHLAIAIGSGTDLAKSQADMIILNNQLGTISKAIHVGLFTMRIIRQNMTWALMYNFSALPLATLGYIPPWLAAIGMSLSSLIVVSNSARLSRL